MPYQLGDVPTLSKHAHLPRVAENRRPKSCAGLPASARPAPCFIMPTDSNRAAVVFQSVQQRGAIDSARPISREAYRSAFCDFIGALRRLHIDEYAPATAGQACFPELTQPIDRGGQRRVTRAHDGRERVGRSCP